MNRTATIFDVSAENLLGGAMLNLDVPEEGNEAMEDKHGFSVQGFTGSRAQDLTFDVDWDPSEVEPPAQCPGGSGTPGTTEETLIEWSLPVDHAEVALTTERPFDHPTTPNWVKRVRTCEQDTLALEVWGLEDVRFQRSPMADSCKGLTELWINTSRARDTDLKTETIDCEDGDQEGKRVEMYPLPTTFWIKHPVPPSLELVPLIDRFFPGALFKSSQKISHFQYLDTAKGCVMLHEDNIEPEANARQLVGHEDAVRGGGCMAKGLAQDGAAATGRFIQQGIQSASRFIMKAAHAGKHGVECLAHDLTSNLGIDWDTDGYAEQRDQPRFHEVHGTLESLSCGVRSKDDSQGSLLRLPDFPGGRTDVNLQSQWRPSSGQAPINTLIPGTLDIPDSSLTDPRCLEWNYTADPKKCEDRESTRQVHERIAKGWLDDAGRIFENHNEYAVPWREWADPLT